MVKALVLFANGEDGHWEDRKEGLLFCKKEAKNSWSVLSRFRWTGASSADNLPGRNRAFTPGRYPAAMRAILLLLALAGCVERGRTVVSAIPPQPYCTRTLGTAQCFADPAALPDRPAELLDTPVREHLECVRWTEKGGLACLLDQPPRP